MTKQRKTNKKRMQPAKKVTTRLIGIAQRGLDRLGAEYARLLQDPCNAPLAFPVYGGTDGAYLIKVESFAAWGAGAAATSGVLQWTPGAIGTNNLDVLTGEGASAGAAITPGVSNTGPGKAFLQANASMARCVAACITLTYPGTELNRSGLVGYGQVNGSVLSTTATSVNDLLPLLERSERTPAHKIELLWTPLSNDMLWTDPSVATSQNELDRKAALAFAWTGLPVATGLMFKFTAVYEYTPNLGKGLAVPRFVDTSNNTLQEVLNFLRRGGETFVRSAAAGATTSAMNYLMRAQGGRQAGYRAIRGGGEL